MKIPVLFLFFLALQCSNPGNQSREQERDQLDTHKKEIVDLAASSVCSEEYTCKYAGLGSKPCGGFWEYITYSTSINEEDLLSKIKRYNQLEETYNSKYGIISDCSFVMPPDSVICENGKCKAVYNH